MSQQSLIRHYSRGTLAADVDESLRLIGKDPARLTVDDLEAVDEFHMGGRPATLALLDAAGFAVGMKLIDVGSGLGGPARVAASTRGVDVTGIDLTPEFVALANDLSRRVGLGDKTRFIEGSGTAMSFEARRFDGATMLHVGMNIADKTSLMREVRRVLRPGARFAIYDIMRIGDGDLIFPLPWSSVAETSAVATPADYVTALEAAGFSIESQRDRRAELKAYAAAMASASPFPADLPHRGPDWSTKVDNLAAMVKSGRLAPFEFIARVI